MLGREAAGALIHAAEGRLREDWRGKRRMPLTGVDHLALTVSDLDRSVEWHCVNLGFEPLVRHTGEGRR